ncbi:hypothetical protein ACQZV8_17625 [Magnetococcales bacterium HHB-1]
MKEFFDAIKKEDFKNFNFAQRPDFQIALLIRQTQPFIKIKIGKNNTVKNMLYFLGDDLLCYPYGSVEQWSKNIEQRGTLLGKQKGKAELVLHLLQKKFKSLPAHIPETLSNAITQQLETWGNRQTRSKRSSKNPKSINLTCKIIDIHDHFLFLKT